MTRATGESDPGRTLEALGYGVVPAERPLTYPGRAVAEPALLTGRELRALRVLPRRLGAWEVAGADRPLDTVLAGLGRPGAGDRHPVMAVGSNASPGQLHHKLLLLGLEPAVPLVPVRVTGIAVGRSAHISRHGYVAAAPYAEESAREVLAVAWLDAGQLAAVDDTEPHYRRTLLPGDRFPMVLPSGERLGGAYAYVSRHGLLAGAGGRPRTGRGDQRELLAALLGASSRLHELLGPDPETWVRRARADAGLRERGTRLFLEEGWVLPWSGLPAPADESSEPYRYDDLGGAPGPAQ